MALITRCTATGEQHGLLSNLPNAVPFDDFKSMAEENRAKCRKELAHRKKIVKARYINRRNKLERLEKAFCAGMGEPIQLWKFIPEEIYEVPMGLVEEVNESRMPIRSDLVSVDGVSLNKDDSPTKKDSYEIVHEFVPLSF